MEHSALITTLQTAATALSLVPGSHWTAETHQSNISSYDGTAAIPSLTSSSFTPSPPDDADEGFLKTRIVADKAFKKELYHYLRWALCAGTPGPGIPETMEILGRAESIRRLEEARRLLMASKPPYSVKDSSDASSGKGCKSGNTNSNPWTSSVTSQSR
jgi:glutamyl-tRNA synthetase